MLSSPTVIGLLAGGSAAGLERAAPFTVAEGQSNFAAIAFRQEDEDLRALYDKRLAQLKADGTLVEIMRKYGFGEPETVSDTITAEKLCTEIR